MKISGLLNHKNKWKNGAISLLFYVLFFLTGIFLSAFFPGGPCTPPGFLIIMIPSFFICSLALALRNLILVINGQKEAGIPLIIHLGFLAAGIAFFCYLSNP